jgi:hypothetical protein
MIRSSTERPLFVVGLFLPERPTLLLCTLGGQVRRAIRVDHVVVGTNQHGVRVNHASYGILPPSSNLDVFPRQLVFQTQVVNTLLHNNNPSP